MVEEIHRAQWDDDDEHYAMPAFTGRNILIFSDGTGQAGGIRVDEARSNVYKLFRATRCGPDSTIDPDRQLAFYDPGLGSALAGENIKVRFVRRIINKLSSATGLGITHNIIECYIALLNLWRPGDRIFLFGFSRGAYTVRCLAGVIGLCGIPTKDGDGNDLRRNPELLRKIATTAVKRVYRHGSGAADRDKSSVTPRAIRLKAQRDALGVQFRERHGSKGPLGPNVFPHFIGVWDTVAAVGVSPAVGPYLWLSAAAVVVGGSALFAAIITYFDQVTFLETWLRLSAVLAMAGLLTYVAVRFKVAFDVPGHKWWQTIHFTNLRMKFFDRHLNENVRYARHALSIDEMRKDFARVAWANDREPPGREKEEGAFLRQLWFAGNHSDVGGSYPENESRLSDIALRWMVNQAKKAGLLVNNSLMHTYGSHRGMQHDECKIPIPFGPFRFRWSTLPRKMVPNATLHESVKRRFDEKSVLIYDEDGPYRPLLLEEHENFKAVYLAEKQARDGAAATQVA